MVAFSIGREKKLKKLCMPTQNIHFDMILSLCSEYHQEYKYNAAQDLGVEVKHTTILSYIYTLFHQLYWFSSEHRTNLCYMVVI